MYSVNSVWKSITFPYLKHENELRLHLKVLSDSALVPDWTMLPGHSVCPFFRNHTRRPINTVEEKVYTNVNTSGRLLGSINDWCPRHKRNRTTREGSALPQTSCGLVRFTPLFLQHIDQHPARRRGSTCLSCFRWCLLRHKKSSLFASTGHDIQRWVVLHMSMMWMCICVTSDERLLYTYLSSAASTNLLGHRMLYGDVYFTNFFWSS